MRVIRLTHGAGNGVDKACLMTASNMLIGRGQDGDNNSCVCPVIRRFIIRTNDAMPETLLGELYGPLIWEILGTKSDDPEVERKRGYCFADWAVRVVAPIRMDILGQHEVAARLRALPEIMDRETAEQARRTAAAAAAAAADAAAYAAAAAAAAAAAYAAAYAAVDAAVDAAADAAVAAYAAVAAGAAVDAAADAAVAAYAAVAADAAVAAKIWWLCPEIIRKAAAIGDKRPVECVITREQLCEALG